jgi:hypothetical protein
MAAEKFKYHFLRYDRYHALRPNLLLKLVFLYYLKDIFLVVAIAATAFKTRGPSAELSAMASLAAPKMMFANVPMLLICFAWLSRIPLAGKFPRWIWRNGRHLIALGAALSSVLIWTTPMPDKHFAFWVLIGLLALNAVTVAYVYFSEVVGDVFRDFPPPAPTQPRDP